MLCAPGADLSKTLVLGGALSIVSLDPPTVILSNLCPLFLYTPPLGPTMLYSRSGCWQKGKGGGEAGCRKCSVHWTTSVENAACTRMRLSTRLRALSCRQTYTKLCTLRSPAKAVRASSTNNTQNCASAQSCVVIIIQLPGEAANRQCHPCSTHKSHNIT